MGHCRLLCAGLAPRAAGWRHRRIDAAQPPFSPPQWAETKLSSLRAERQQYGRGARANLAAEIAEWEQYVADEHEAQALQVVTARVVHTDVVVHARVPVAQQQVFGWGGRRGLSR